MQTTADAKNKNTSRPSSEMMEVIHSNFPEILSKAPAELSPLNWGEELEGFCNHPTLFNPNWVTAFGEQAFKSETGLPEGFFAYGYKESYGSAFFVMWQEKGRRFWLFEHFSGLSSNSESVQSPSSSKDKSSTRSNFLTALKHWEKGGYRKPQFG